MRINYSRLTANIFYIIGLIILLLSLIIILNVLLFKIEFKKVYETSFGNNQMRLEIDFGGGEMTQIVDLNINSQMSSHRNINKFSIVLIKEIGLFLKIGDSNNGRWVSGVELLVGGVIICIICRIIKSKYISQTRMARS